MIMEPAMEQSIPVGVRHIQEETELELTEAHKRISVNEIRLGLMKDLMKHGLCTKDIYSFACTQADLCAVISDPDKSTIGSAMRTKIRDLKQLLKNDHRQRRQKERELLIQMGGRSWKVRKKITRIKRGLRQEREKLVKKYADKLQHYKSTMSRLEQCGQLSQRTVGMDGMNKSTAGGGWGGGFERTVAVNGMNNITPEGGG